MKRRFMKRALSILLAVAMVLGNVQLPVMTQEVQAATTDAVIPSDNMAITVSGTFDVSGTENYANATGDVIKAAIFDGSSTTWWNSSTVTAIAKGTPYLQVDLRANYDLSQVDYTPRWDASASWGCTGNISTLIVEVSADGNTWTDVTNGGQTLDLTSTDSAAFPVEISFTAESVRYVRISGTTSYHWGSSPNTSITIGDLAIYGTQLPISDDVMTLSGTGTYQTTPDNEGNVGSVTWKDIKTNLFDGDNTDTFWNSNHLSGSTISEDDPYVQIDLNGMYDLTEIDYTPRYSNGWQCTGNITKLNLQVSSDGSTWTTVTPDGGETISLDGTMTFPHAVTFEADDVRYIRVSGDASYHLQSENENTSITIGDLAVYGTLAVDENAITPITMGTKPEDGTTTAQPFIQNTVGGSTYFRIPSLITLSDGRLLAAADARWDTTYDGECLDTVVSYSKDKGATWNYTFANYLGDHGNTQTSNSTAFLDAIMAEKDGTVYLMVDLYNEGTDIWSVQAGTGYGTETDGNAEGHLLLRSTASTAYEYYLGDFTDGKASIYKISDGTAVDGYEVDEFFNLTKEGDSVTTNLFFSNSPFQVLKTSYLYMTKSIDGGETWSAPVMLNHQVKDSSETFYGVGPGRGLVTSDGTIVFTCYRYLGGDQRSSIIYSKDGVTWERSDDATGSDMWSSESQIVEIDSNTLRLFFRNGNGCVCYVDATGNADVGYTWGEVVRTSVSNESNCQLSAIKYSKRIDGKDAIIVSCPTASNRYSGRIFVGLINDDKTIEWKYTYDDLGDGMFQYSCLTELSDGSIGILYEDGAASITYANIAIADIAEGALIEGFWLEDENGNAVNSLKLTPGKEATLSVDGTVDGTVTVTSSGSNVAAVTLNADNTITITASSTVTGTAVITVTDESGTVVTLNVTVTETSNDETVELKVGETKIYTDETGNYSNADLSDVDTNVATVTAEGYDSSYGYHAQVGNGGGKDSSTAVTFAGDYVELADCEFTFDLDTTGGYYISGKTDEGNDVWVYLGNNAQQPSDDTQQLTYMNAGATAGTFTISSASGSGNYLHFWSGENDSNGNSTAKYLQFDRCGSNGCTLRHEFELFEKVAKGVETPLIPGYTKVTAITDGGSYLIAKRVDGTYYVMHPTAEGSNAYKYVAEVKAKEPTVQVGSSLSNNITQFSDTVQNISDCLYTFTAVDGGYHISTVAANGTTYYLNPSGQGSVQHPNSTTAVTMMVASAVTTNYPNTFSLSWARTNDTGYLYFWSDRHYFDALTSVADQCCFEIYTPSTDDSSSPIEGYKQITSVDEIQSGSQYLIAAKVGTDYYFLHPSGDYATNANTYAYAHVAKLANGKASSDNATEITIEAVNLGQTTAVIGDTTYHIKVEDNVVNVKMKVGETYTAEGAITQQDAAQTVVSVQNSLEAPYTVASELVSGQSYLIGTSSYLIKPEAQTSDRNFGTSYGLGMVSAGTITSATADYSEHAWKVTIISKTDEGYTGTIQTQSGNYVCFDDPANNISGNTHVRLSDTEQVLRFVDKGNGLYAIGYTSTTDSSEESYFNNYGDGNSHVAGWETDGSTWYFYTGENTVTLIGAEVGTTSMIIGGVTYNIEVVEDSVDITLEIGEQYLAKGTVTEDVADADVASTSTVAAFPSYTIASGITSGTIYLIGRTLTGDSAHICVLKNEVNGDGLNMVNNADYAAGEYADYAWRVTAVDGVTNGYTLQNVTTGKYFAFSGATVLLSDTPQTVIIEEVTDEGRYYIRNASNTAIYLHDTTWSSGHTFAKGYESNGDGSKWNIYTGTDGVGITGESVGTTSLRVDGVKYNVTVVEYIDYALYDQQVAIAQILVNDTGYTDESRNALAEVLAEAEAMTRHEEAYSSADAFNAEQEAVDVMVERLTVAIKELQKKSVSIALAVGETVKWSVSGALDGNTYSEADKAVADISVESGVMTIVGNEAGIAQVTAGGVLYNILVADSADDFPIVGKTGEAASDASNPKAVTKLTISANNTFDLGLNITGTNVEWSTGAETTVIDENGTTAPVVTLTTNDDGTVTITCADTLTTVYTTVTATVTKDEDGDGTEEEYVYTIPVIVHPAPESSGRIYNIYIDEISNTDVYYSWNCSTDLIQACEGEAIYVSLPTSEPNALDFLAAEHDGYALSYMAATNSDGEYMAVHTGDDVTLDTSTNGFLNFPGGAGEAQAGMFGTDGQDGEAVVMAMLYAGIDRGADGATGFTRAANAPGDINSSMTFSSDKRPTVSKSVTGILPANIKRAEFRQYTPGMTARVNEYVYFAITVTNYRPLSIYTQADADKDPDDNIKDTDVGRGPVKYSDVQLLDTALPGVSFIVDRKDEVLTEDQIIPSPAVVSKNITEDLANDVWLDESLEQIDHTYYVAYKIQEDDLGDTLKNTVDLEYTYKSSYSTGSGTAASQADAEITVASFVPKNLVVDFGIPVTVEYETWTTTDVATNTAKTVELAATGTANYGTVTVERLEKDSALAGWNVTYTPTGILSSVDTVTISASNCDETYTFNVYPASSVYYEETFMTPAGESEWTQSGTIASDMTQEDAQPGQKDVANYGYDAAYADAANTEIYTAATADGREKAIFTFTGTGVDIYANCDADTGIAMVQIRKVETVDEEVKKTLKKVLAVDTVLTLGTVDAGTALNGYTETLNVPIVSLPEGSLEHGEYEVTILHTVKKATVIDQYSSSLRFEFPTDSRIGKTLEAEAMVLNNTGTDETWEIQVSEKDWASNGKIVNAMNNGDTAVLYYNAPKAGVYIATVTYRSGSESNGFSWSEANGNITAGSVVMGANDSAEATHTKEITLEVVTAGEGVLTFATGGSNAPQIDKLDIRLISYKADSLAEGIYSNTERFEFPTDSRIGKTLEAEAMVLNNMGTDEAWPMQITEKDWASNGKIVNAMNNGDTAVLYYNTPKAGAYIATVTYRSGSENNGFSWSEANGNITAGSVIMGANDSAGATHTKEITLEVVTAGEGVLTFATGDSNAPQIDKLDIRLAETDVEYRADLLPTETKLRLDGFRVYGTMAADAEAIYSLDNEANPQYIEMRDSLMAIWSVSSTNSADYAEQLAKDTLSQIYASAGATLNDSNNAMILDSKDNEVKYTGDNLTDFLDNSSKNEIYLYPGQSLMFALDAATNNPQIGLKSLGTETRYSVKTVSELVDKTELAALIAEAEALSEDDYSTNDGWTTFTEKLSAANTVNDNTDASRTEVDVAVSELQAAMNALLEVEEESNDIEMKANAEMYYKLSLETDATGTAVDTTFTIKNTGSGILAITKLKVITGVNGQMVVSLAEITEDALAAALYNPDANEPTGALVTDVFTDIAEGAWYVDSIQYVYDKGILTGDGDVFAPDEDATRAMIAQILYRMEGSPKVTDFSKYDEFTDLAGERTWYSDAVAWALNEGISTGDDYNKLYNPNMSVTREQLALFLWKYAKYNGEDVAVDKDADEILNGTYVSEWAKEGFLWAVDKGIIKGSESIGADGNVQYELLPQNGATRAQLARMLHRFLGGTDK